MRLILVDVLYLVTITTANAETINVEGLRVGDMRKLQFGPMSKEIPFVELIQNIEQSVKNIYLPQYEELETLVTEEDTEYFKLARFMGDHERALLLSTENINNNSNKPMKPVTEMLRFPILWKKEN